MLKRPWLLFCIVTGISYLAMANSTSVEPTTTPAADPEITLASTPLSCNAQLSGKSVVLGNALVNGLGPQLTCSVTLNIKNGGSLKSLVLTHNGNGGASRTITHTCTTTQAGSQNCRDEYGSRHARAWFKVTYTGCGLLTPVTKLIAEPGVFQGNAQAPYSFPIYLLPKCADNDAITVQLQHYLDETSTFGGQPTYSGSAGFVQELSVNLAPNAPQPSSSSVLMAGFTWLVVAAMTLAVL